MESRGMQNSGAFCCKAMATIGQQNDSVYNVIMLISVGVLQLESLGWLLAPQ